MELIKELDKIFEEMDIDGAGYIYEGMIVDEVLRQRGEHLENNNIDKDEEDFFNFEVPLEFSDGISAIVTGSYSNEEREYNGKIVLIGVTYYEQIEFIKSDGTKKFFSINWSDSE